MDKSLLHEIGAAIWASRYPGLEVAALFALLRWEPMTRAELGRRLPERTTQHVYAVARRLLQRRVMVLAAPQNAKKRRRLIVVNPEYQEWRGPDGTLTFAVGTNPRSALTIRLGHLHAVTTQGAPVPRVDPLHSKTNIKGEPYGDEPGQRHLVDPEGALNQTEAPPCDPLAERLKATRRRE